ncbi:hypothetical protein C454_06482 [Haloferax gibbonsii ATCC 33959]|uniref:Uncharacterized protein n=1 Tax=Haloferax gibbonsii (strain ATCC 33959 / DSM 4427 / JCM 8863 / NBRC 102184 / NCIMB 2188 / Ma 2.38) TaxID=1227459 RepID=M0HHF4_HALGM|nr:hypothetical protein C454_06482 [Haloferax gibbonsii ATCC 33959]
MIDPATGAVKSDSLGRYSGETDDRKVGDESGSGAARRRDGRGSAAARMRLGYDSKTARDRDCRNVQAADSTDPAFVRLT